MQDIQTFNAGSFQNICDTLGSTDPDLRAILNDYGYPPRWNRPNNFETLVHFILEQQVSLASALSALQKLKSSVPAFTPENLLALSAEDMRACYCSRQKQAYIRGVASAMLNGELDLDAFTEMDNEQIRVRLTSLKGIGNWTADVYLMFVLARADVFPTGDLAAVNALKSIKLLPPETSKEQLIKISLQWQPYRTIATMILWHFYLSKRAKAQKLTSG